MGKNKKMMKEVTTLDAAFSMGCDEIGSLAEEMGEWRDNMSGTNLESTSKYEDVDETASSLENIHGNLEGQEMPNVMQSWPVEYSYIRPYGKKPMSRYDRSSMACSALQAITDTFQIILDALEEKREGITEGNRSPDESLLLVLDADQIKDLDDEALEKLGDEIKDIQSEIEDAISELENVEFPGFY